jgi:GNAT superfamily N-acetyltransferase
VSETTRTQHGTASIAPIPSVPSVSELSLVAERGEGARTRVNAFLEAPDVEHTLGSVPGWLMAWSARYRDVMIAVCVLSRPVARASDDGATIAVSRLAARPERPANTGSWLLARARQWAALSGYDQLIAHAGVAGNEGTVYAAAGFECEGVTRADGDGWQTREGRTAWNDDERRRWLYDLTEVRP